MDRYLSFGHTSPARPTTDFTPTTDLWPLGLDLWARVGSPDFCLNVPPISQGAPQLSVTTVWLPVEVPCGWYIYPPPAGVKRWLACLPTPSRGEGAGWNVYPPPVGKIWKFGVHFALYSIGYNLVSFTTQSPTS